MEGTYFHPRRAVHASPRQDRLILVRIMSRPMVNHSVSEHGVSVHLLATLELKPAELRPVLEHVGVIERPIDALDVRGVVIGEKIGGEDIDNLQSGSDSGIGEHWRFEHVGEGSTRFMAEYVAHVGLGDLSVLVVDPRHP